MRNTDDENLEPGISVVVPVYNGAVNLERLVSLLETALHALTRALQGARAGQPEELVAVDLAETLSSLEAVHGRSTPEDLLDRIFAGFCLGK